MAVKERPILMSAPMVKALLDGRKTQTRRIIKPQPIVDTTGTGLIDTYWLSKPLYGLVLPRVTDIACECPYGDIGDRLWIKEAWRVSKKYDSKSPKDIWEKLKKSQMGVTVLYESGGWKSVCPVKREEPKYGGNEPMPSWAGRKRSSMFMPRWASRILLEITDIRVERLNNISEQDAIAEGLYILPETQRFAITRDDHFFGKASDNPIDVYQWLWESINGDGSWSQNPFVWCVTFRRLHV